MGAYDASRRRLGACVDPGCLVEHLHNQGIARGVVLDAVRYVPRDRFVPRAVQAAAWEDRPLAIGEGQTISQPYTTAFMLQLAELSASERVLEVGAGCGYVLALAAYVVGDPALVVGIETNETLFHATEQRLRDLGLEKIHLIHGDGKEGAMDKAPFDVIIVSAQTGQVPQTLTDQLAVGGRMIIPVDVGSYAAMTCVRRTKDGIVQSRHGAFRFVPLT